ncbi:hypothetical protein GW17_00017164 [Ensete ventricosum]|nr:hypothetical protein GW17_00017164 [Ensete ventricosum]
MRFDSPLESSGAAIGRRAENMSETKDPAIKLFGTTIPVVASSPTRIADAEDAEVEAGDTEPVMSAAEGQKVRTEATHLFLFFDWPSLFLQALFTAKDHMHEVEKHSSSMFCFLFRKDASEGVINVEVNNVLATEADEEDEGAAISSSGLTSGHKDEVNKTSIADEKTAAKVKSETDCSTPEKVLKKPDKILPCPRCNSMDTKFCYYNNYNVNQPRHFCKNCQRYWTAGGTMRNVPVGAGRRKSKHSVASQCRSLVVPSTMLQSAQPDTPNSARHQRALPCAPTSPARPLIGNGTVLRFGQEVPLCESVASVLGIRGEQAETADSGSTMRGDNREEPRRASSDTERSGVQKVYCNGLATWAYPWGPTWNDVAAAEAHSCRPENGGDSVSVPWGAGAVMAATLPFPLMAAPFWGFTAWPNGTWNASSPSNRGCSGNDSPTLGKHSRDGNSESEETTERCLWVPKTLRIDDPEEAAKSSIWAALGIKPDMGGIIFQSKAEKRGNESAAARILHANPAALSRFESFQEST